LDPNVAALIKFLNKTAGSKVIKLASGGNDLEQLQNNLIHYDDSCSFTGPTKHAEQYHLAVCDGIATACHAREISIPNFYIAGTKRACSTCTGTIKEYKAKPLLTGHLFVEDRYPGNLWTAQNVNQTDAAMAFTKANLQARRIHITAYKQRRTIKTTSGFNSDSESEAEDDGDDDI